jgi:hypothetical protein
MRARNETECAFELKLRQLDSPWFARVWLQAGYFSFEMVADQTIHLSVA